MFDKIIKSTWLSGVILFLISAILIVSTIGLASDVYFNLYGAIIGIQNGHKIAEYELIFLLAFLKTITVFLLSYFTFGCLSLLDVIFTYQAYKSAAGENEIKEFDIKEIIQKTLRWSYFKTGYILAPHFILFCFLAVLGSSAFIFFNYFSELAGYSIGIAAFVSVFLFTLLIFLFITAATLSTWRHITTFYGYECAVSEPALPNIKIIRRSEKLFFSDPFNAVLYLVNSAYIGLVIYQIFKYITFPSFISIENSSAVFAALALNFIFIGSFKFFKAKMYVNSLIRYYEKITFNSERYYNQFQKLYLGNDKYKFIE